MKQKAHWSFQCIGYHINGESVYNSLKFSNFFIREVTYCWITKTWKSLSHDRSKAKVKGDSISVNERPSFNPVTND